MNNNVFNKVIVALNPRTYLNMIESDIISTTEEDVVDKKFCLLTEPDDVDIKDINLDGLTIDYLRGSELYNRHAFDDNGVEICVDKIGIENIDEIQKVIGDDKIINMIEKILYLYDVNNINVDLKIGVKMKCYVYLKTGIGGPIISLKLDNISKLMKLQRNQ